MYDFVETARPATEQTEQEPASLHSWSSTTYDTGDGRTNTRQQQSAVEPYVAWNGADNASSHEADTTAQPNSDSMGHADKAQTGRATAMYSWSPNQHDVAQELLATHSTANQSHSGTTPPTPVHLWSAETYDIMQEALYERIDGTGEWSET